MRLLETTTLLKLIVPMMGSEMEGNKIAIYGLRIFKNLTYITENNEYGKLTTGLPILVSLFKEDGYYKITNLCIESIGNLCMQSDNLSELDATDTKRATEGGIFEVMLSKHLEDSDSKTQTSILKMFNYLTNLHAETIGDAIKDSIAKKVKTLFFEKRLLEKVVACFVSLDKNVAVQSLSILM